MSPASSTIARRRSAACFTGAVRTIAERIEPARRAGTRPRGAAVLRAGIVDRLEKLGLAERPAVPHDRRVKLVVLTPDGQRTQAELLRQFYEPPADLRALDREDLDALDRVLSKLTPGAAGGGTSRPTARQST